MGRGGGTWQEQRVGGLPFELRLQMLGVGRSRGVPGWSLETLTQRWTSFAYRFPGPAMEIHISVCWRRSWNLHV